MVTLCIMNDRIIALSGKYSRKKIKVKYIKDIELSEGSLVNGLINNEYEVKHALYLLKKDKKIKLDNAKMILNSTLIYYKKMTLPSLSKKFVQKQIASEFNSYKKDEERKIADYRVLSRNAEHKNAYDVLCVGADKKLIDLYDKLFSSVRIKAKNFGVSADCVISFSEMINKGLHKNYIVVVPDGVFVSVYLFIDDAYFYSTTLRTFNDVSSDEYYQEIVSAVSSAKQFSKSKNADKEIKEAYMFGFPSEGIEKCSEFMIDLGIVVSRTDKLREIVINKSDKSSLDSYFYNIFGIYNK